MKLSLLHIFSALFSQSEAVSSPYYQIVAVDDSYQDTGKVYVKIQVIGSSKVFNQPVIDLYTRQWLDHFSKEDVAHLALLYAAEHAAEPDAISADKPRISNPARLPGAALFLALIFSACLALSNLSIKFAEFKSITFIAGILVYPLVFILTGIITEAYGAKIARLIIFAGFFANILVVIGMWAVAYLPSPAYWQGQSYFAELSSLHRLSLQLVVTSMLAYLVSNLAIAMVWEKLKYLMQKKHLWFRAFISFMIGVGLDTSIFLYNSIAFTLQFSAVWRAIAVTFLFKLLYGLCAIPCIYLLVYYLKQNNMAHINSNNQPDVPVLKLE